jgi:O-antigen/teichoic acid export membrane protein
MPNPEVYCSVFDHGCLRLLSPLSSIAQHFQKEYLSSYFQITAFALVPMTIFSVDAQALRAVKKIAAFSFIQNVSNYLIASLILVAMLAFWGNDSLPVIAYSFAMLISAFVSSFLWNRSRIKTANDSEDVSLSMIIKVALPMLFSTSMLVMMGWTDTIVLGIFRTEEEIGIYNAAYKIALLSSIVLYSVHSIAAPKFSEFFVNNNYQGLQDITQQSTKLMFWLSFPSSSSLRSSRPSCSVFWR